jgi:methyl-accepting chemotaxis protein
MSRLRNSLQAKILILVIVLLGLGFGLSAVITIESERRLLMDQMTERAMLLASTIHKSIRTNMLEGRPDIARALIKEHKRQKGVKALQVFRDDGSEAFTDLRTLIKVQKARLLDEKVAKIIRRQAGRFEKMDSLRGDPNFERALATGKSVHWMEDIEGGENGSIHVLTFLKPLENEPACQACHGEESKVQGVVRVSTDVSGLEAKTADLGYRQIGIAAATMFIVGFALLFFLRRTVVSRIEGLAAAAAQVGRGDFENVPTVGGEDEIGRLGQTFRDMASTLSAAYQDLQSKNAELESTLDELRESRQKVDLLENLKGSSPNSSPNPSSGCWRRTRAPTLLRKRTRT